MWDGLVWRHQCRQKRHHLSACLTELDVSVVYPNLSPSEVLSVCHEAFLDKRFYLGHVSLDGESLWVDMLESRQGKAFTVKIPLDLETWTNPATGEEFSTFEDWIEGLVIYVWERIDVARLVPVAHVGTRFPPAQFVE